MVISLLFISLLLIILFIYFLRERYSNESLKNDIEKMSEAFQIKLNEEIRKARSDAIKSSRAVIKGQVSEQIAPFLPGFNYQPSDCLFIGKPFDFICLNGLSDGDITEIIFIDIKTGKSQLNANQKMLQNVILNKKVRFEVINLDKVKK